MSTGKWVKEFPAEVLVCDPAGVVLEMNAEAASLFAEDGGEALLGTNLLGCHPEPERTKLETMLEQHSTNAYFNTENDRKRLFFQSPWFSGGRFAGYVELSFDVPEDIPHFIRT